MSPFDFLNSINETKEDLFAKDPLNKKDYAPYMVNRGLSYFPDTIMLANEMNFHRDIPIEWQYDFLLSAVSRRKRFSKWAKREKMTEALKAVMKEYDYSEAKAEDVINILDEKQVNVLVEKHSFGGR